MLVHATLSSIYAGY